MYCHRQLDFVAQRSDCNAQLLQAQFQTRFYSPKRRIGRRRNFAVTQSLEESKFDRLALESWERSHALLEKMPQILAHKRIICFATRNSRLLLQLFSITLPCARISLSPAQSIDRAAAGNRYYPTEG